MSSELHYVRWGTKKWVRFDSSVSGKTRVGVPMSNSHGNRSSYLIAYCVPSPSALHLLTHYFITLLRQIKKLGSREVKDCASCHIVGKGWKWDLNLSLKPQSLGHTGTKLGLWEMEAQSGTGVLSPSPSPHVLV